MRRKTETLGTVGLFRSLDDANIELLDTQCSWRRLSRNQWIVDYQDASNDVFFIVSGAVHVKLQSVSGREVLLREIDAGDFFGELAAIDNQPRSAGIIAVTDVTVAFASKLSFSIACITSSTLSRTSEWPFSSS